MRISAAALSGHNLRIEHFPRSDEAHRVQGIVTYVRKFAHAVQDDLCNMHVNGRATGPELAQPSTSGGRITATYRDEYVQETKRGNHHEAVEERDRKVPSTTSDVGDVALAIVSAVQQIVPVVVLQAKPPPQLTGASEEDGQLVMSGGPTVATRNMARSAVGKSRKLAWVVITPSSFTFQKNFMPMTAYTDMISSSNPPTFTMEDIDAAVASRIALIPLNIFMVLINLKSLIATRETRATLMTVAFILSDAADAIETTTTTRSMTLLGSLKYLLQVAPIADRLLLTAR